jgi:hypothetical protein
MKKQLRFLCRAGLALWLSGLVLPASPLITEFMASNQTGLMDEDGDRPDWIELHNPDLVPLDLGGYGLTDDVARPGRWRIPAGTVLPPGGYLVIFASNKDRAVAGQPLHTNFSLSAGSEYLGLTAPGGGVALSEWNPYPPQSGDVSYGLLSPTAGSLSVYFNTPTPGAANDAGGALAGKVVFDPPSSTFASGTPLSIALRTESPTAVVRYTVNRSRPIGVNGVAGNFSANAAADICTWTGHPLRPGDPVKVSGPAPLTATGNYFVTLLGPDTFKLSMEPGGPPVDLTGNGSFTVRRDAAFATASTTDVFTVAGGHGFFNGDPVQLSSTGTLPGGVAADTTYYVAVSSATTFRLSAVPALTPFVDITTVATGVLTVFRTPSPVYAGPFTVSVNTRVRARAFEEGRPPGPMGGEMYFALDANARNLTSPLPMVVSHTWNTPMTDNTIVDGHVMVFEPKAPDNLARLGNRPDLSSPCSLERRGSSTAGDPKYSMAVELQDEFGIDRNLSPLGLPSHSDWIMHAPYNFDRSMMHNDLIYRISNDSGRYAPRTKFVEHIHNVQGVTNTIEGAVTSADYFGVYSFMEKISRGQDRVDVENLTLADNAVPEVQGGYMFKVDRLDAGEVGITPLPGQSFGNVGMMGPGNNLMAWVNPREVTPDPFKKVTLAQSNWLRGHIGEAWAALAGGGFMDPGNGYAKYWDVGAMIDHHIFNTSTKNADGMRLSAHWHKPRYGKITAGPVWDFDRAQGSTDGRDFNWGTWRGDNADLGTDFFHYPWYNEMFRDPNFWQQWVDRYHQLRQGPMSTAAIHARIDEFANQLNPGNAAGTPAKRNVSRWTAIPPRAAGSNTAITNNTFNGQYTGEVAWLKYWWQKRLEFMDNQFTRPAVANLASGPVPAGSVVTLSSPSTATPGVKIYYTTDGSDPRPRATQPVQTGGGFVTVDTFLREVSPVRVIVPTSASTGGPANQWRGADANGNGDNADDFDDSGWFANAPGTLNGVGYDNSFAAGAVDFQPFFSVRWNTSTYFESGATPPGVSPVSASNVMFAGTINGTAYPGNQSCYLRLPFDLTSDQMALVKSGNRLVLQIRCDDGYVAWINGTELTSARLNAPATASLAWNTPATATNADANAVLWADYDISAAMPALHAGRNLLAIHALNQGLTSSDFLIAAKIVIQTPPPPFAPDVNPAAVEYTGPITVSGPLALFVRTVNPVRPSDPPTQSGGGTGTVPNGSSWSAPTVLYYFPGAVLPAVANLKITEVMYHPASPTAAEVAVGFTNSNDFEFIRLTNVGTEPLDLTGIYFSNGVQFTAAEGIQNWLAAGASVVVVENRAGYASRYGVQWPVLGEYSGDLNDAGERLVLNARDGTVLSEFRYDDANGWPPLADEGHSLVWVSGDPALPASWLASLDPGGLGVSTYDGWAKRYFADSAAAEAAAGADPDADGLGNFGEYAFGTDPRVAGTREAGLAVLVPGNPLQLSVRRRAGTGLRWELESFTIDEAAAGWVVVPGAAAVVTAAGDGSETAVWPAPEGTARGQLLRVRVRPAGP